MKSNHRTDLATFEALDQLPPELFREVCFANRVWDAPQILDLYRDATRARGKSGAITWLRDSIHAGDEQEIMNFSWKYQTRYKHPLPHFAANATILRFCPAVHGPEYRLRTGDIRRKAAFRSSERLLPKAYA